MGKAKRPKPMTLPEFQQRFGSDAKCRERLFQARWPEGFRCPRCAGTRAYVRRNRPLLECAGCGYQASVTAGTMFHRSHVALHKWFLALFLEAQEKRGISALALMKFLGVSYETAWSMLHKIRRAMQVREERYRLQGLIEMDDAYFGGVVEGKVGRGTTKVKAIVAVEVNEEGFPEHGRIAVVKDFTQETVTATVQGIVAPEACLLTDGLGAFGGLEAAGFGRQATRTQDVPAGVEPFPYVHTLISNGKAWLQGTFHGLGPKYMQAYLSELCYRFNRRRLEHRLFDHLLTACAAAPHVPLTAIQAG